MNSILFDPSVGDDSRRALLYQGQLIVLSPTANSKALCDFARELTEEAFAPRDPREAQFAMSVEAYAKVLETLKPKFIHHPKCKELLRGLLRDLNCDLKKTYFDVPRLRTATSGGYLTSGIAYAFHPHRDTWYSAPASQINWWLPVYDIEPENCMALHPQYWNRPVRNSSREYNYYEWNKESRKNAAQHIKSDTRKQPRPEEPIDPDPQLRIVCPVGAVILFSAAHMHSTVPNTSGRTRISVDFRTVHLDDVIARTGAPNVDSACTGTNLRDFLQADDLSRLPENVVAGYDPEPPGDAVLVFQPGDDRSK